MKNISIKNLTLGTGRPKICLPIVGRTLEEIHMQAARIMQNPVDIIEWRADWYEELLNLNQLEKAIEEIRSITGETPLLFTIRTAAEGGESDLSFEAYCKVLLHICKKSLADAVDVEILISSEEKVKSLIRELRKDAVVIASSHDFAKTPDKGVILNRLNYMKHCGADICKMAVMPKTTEDVLTLLSATTEAHAMIDAPIITMSMGKLGLISRISGEVFGSALTFGCVGTASAPGQINAEELNSILENIHKNL